MSMRSSSYAWFLKTVLLAMFASLHESAFVPPTTEHYRVGGSASFQEKTKPMYSSLSPETSTYPTPELEGLQVVKTCMDALQMKPPNEALEVCFDFSSDRCRAAVGGTLEQFVRYADNPVFGTLVNCDAYEIISIGPIIPGATHGLGSRRGEMQTFLLEVTEGMSLKTVMKGAEQRTRKRPTLQERFRQRELKRKGEQPEEDGEQEITVEQVDDGKRRFLWTLQKERRPPRQDCWLVQEVLFTKNAFHHTS